MSRVWLAACGGADGSLDDLQVADSSNTNRAAEAASGQGEFSANCWASVTAESISASMASSSAGLAMASSFSIARKRDNRAPLFPEPRPPRGCDTYSRPSLRHAAGCDRSGTPAGWDRLHRGHARQLLWPPADCQHVVAVNLDSGHAIDGARAAMSGLLLKRIRRGPRWRSGCSRRRTPPAASRYRPCSGPRGTPRCSRPRHRKRRRRPGGFSAACDCSRPRRPGGCTGPTMPLVPIIPTSGRTGACDPPRPCEQPVCRPNSSANKLTRRDPLGQGMTVAAVRAEHHVAGRKIGQTPAAMASSPTYVWQARGPGLSGASGQAAPRTAESRPSSGKV